MVMEVVEEEEMEDETGMSCTDHPYNKTPAGGICAFCLQEKLGKLVSSSFPSSIFPASSSMISSPRYPSLPKHHHHQPSSFHNIITKTNTSHSLDTSINNTNKNVDNVSIVFRRSKSTITVNNNRTGGGFWSFLALTRSRTALPRGDGGGQGGSLRESTDYHNNNNNDDNDNGDEGVIECFSRGGDDERKVSRSRSVGCGSRSFSGDFFERISTGFGDCTLRRVESQREGKNKVTKMKNTPVHHGASSSGGDRVRCGGIFGGFSSSSSSSSSTTNWGAPPAPTNVQAARGHWRSRSWGWALASPMRVFSKPKRKASANVTPNLNAIPSILAVGG